MVDKPQGPTSHDVVGRIRKRLDTGRVGHAGTLDPMATGVLVIAVGEATKLVPYLTAADKAYSASIALGVGTDSLDAEGERISEGPALAEAVDRVRVQAVADGFLGGHKQRAPRVSAIKVDGERLHAKARRGDDFEAPERDVVLHSVRILAVQPDRIDLELEAAKGFYVRSFGRDLAAALGTVGHLTALRRTASGAFRLPDAVGLEALGPESLMDPAEAAARVMPRFDVSEEEARDLWQGRAIAAQGEEPGPVALVHGSQLVAIATTEDRHWHVARGFRPPGRPVLKTGHAMPSRALPRAPLRLRRRRR